MLSSRPKQPEHHYEQCQQDGDQPVHPDEARYPRLGSSIGLPVEHGHAEECCDKGPGQEENCQDGNGLHGAAIPLAINGNGSRVLGFILRYHVQDL